MPMTRDITNRIVRCREDINALKTTQQTQADSYAFYKYRTDDLYVNATRTVQVIFHPLKADKTQVICNFFVGDLRQTTGYVSSNGGISVSDPLKFTYNWSSASNLQDFQKHIYITCVSNVEGWLQTIIS